MRICDARIIKSLNRRINPPMDPDEYAEEKGPERHTLHQRTWSRLTVVEYFLLDAVRFGRVTCTVSGVVVAAVGPRVGSSVAVRTAAVRVRMAVAAVAVGPSATERWPLLLRIAILVIGVAVIVRTEAIGRVMIVVIALALAVLLMMLLMRLRL